MKYNNEKYYNKLEEGCHLSKIYDILNFIIELMCTIEYKSK